MPDSKKDSNASSQQPRGLAESISTNLDTLSSGLRNLGSGIADSLKINFGANKKRIVKPEEIYQLERVLLMKYPKWDRLELRKYLLTIAQIVPDLYVSPYAIEEIVKKAFNYGGLEPSMLLQYASMMPKGL